MRRNIFVPNWYSASLSWCLRADWTYITYCDDIGCNGSTTGTYKLAKLSISVKELIGGLE